MTSTSHPALSTPFSARALSQTHPLARYLLQLMSLKRTNLCVSADVTSTVALLRLCDEVGDSICVLKTHCDIIDDFGSHTINALREVSARKGFIIFEDRKFGDIGSTVQKQYTSGPLRIISFASLTNAHLFPGPLVITALKSAAQQNLASYNRSVYTEISAGPPPDLDTDEEDENEVATTTDDEEADELWDRPTLSHRTTSSSSAGKGKGKSTATQPQAMPGRKSSIVSTTVIETTSEPIDAHRGTPSSPTIPRRTRLDVPGSSLSPGPASGGFSNWLEELGPAPLERGLLILAEMSSEGNLLTPAYTTACLEAAREHKDFVLGFVAQSPLNRAHDDDFIIFTPGVSLPPLFEGDDDDEPAKWNIKGDGLGQQYRTPHTVILEGGADVIIVGRGIISARDRKGEVERYRREGWKAIETRWGGGN